MAACAPAPEQGVVNNTAGSAVIYGEDTRQEINADSNLKQQISATALLVESRKLHVQERVFTFDLFRLKDNYPLCEGERFTEQPVLGFCSGVLIAPDKVLTAAHCLNTTKTCEDTRFVFGWSEAKSRVGTFASSEVYACKNIVKQVQNIGKGLDYAVIELDRPVAGATPVTIAPTAPTPGESVVSLSYPLGLPMKKDVGRILPTSTATLLKTEVDTFSGSSGSPLFDTEGRLVGILSRGTEDFDEDDIYNARMHNTCVNFQRCKNGSCFGESFVNTSILDL